MKESDEQKAERLVGEMLRAAGWTEEELKHRPKGDIKKARMAVRLRSETAMTWLWIAKRLEMGGEHRPTQCGPARDDEANMPLVISDPFSFFDPF